MTTIRPATRARVLPREHGAYGLLLFPLASALLLRPGLAAAALATACVAGFLAHAPLLLLLRVPRAAPEARALAGRWLALLVPLALLAGAAGLAVAPSAARLAAAVVALPVAAAIALRAAGLERSAAFQLLAAIVLPACSIPVAVASGARPGDAAVPAIVWGSGFLVACAAVRLVKARTSRRAELASAAAAGALGLLSVGSLVGAGATSPAALLAIGPFLVLALGLAVRPPAPRRLRAVGWSVVGASAATLALLATTTG